MINHKFILNIYYFLITSKVFSSSLTKKFFIDPVGIEPTLET